jgi:phage shock protein PspC (stress-responsive transcriptional regulator)
MNVPVNTSLIKQLQWLQANAESNGEYTIVVTSDENIEAQTLSFPDKSNITVRLTGEGEKIISLKGKGSLFTVESAVTLILGNGVTLQGCDENDKSLINIKSGGNFTMIGGKISGNIAFSSGAGVRVSSGGNFMMTDGEISGNKAAIEDPLFLSNGGGISNFGNFTMTGGKISGNIAFGSGGGVHVAEGNFTMSGGEISGNTAAKGEGGGVNHDRGGNFTMSGGEISGNTAQTMAGGVSIFGGSHFIMSYGKIINNTTKGNGGGVLVGETCTFEVSDCQISGNTANEGSGGGVFVNPDGNFKMKGGEISSNTTKGSGGGVAIIGNFIMENGVISGNNSYVTGGGVVLNGSFIMRNGIISNNKATSISSKKSAGGGVDVLKNGNFTMKDGKIFGNTADVDPQVRVGISGQFNKIGGTVDGSTSNSSDSNGCYRNKSVINKNMMGGTVGDNTSNSGGSSGCYRNKSMINKRKSLWLCLFLGWLGVHRFYEHKIETGILYLCTFGIFGIGWIIDLMLLVNEIKPLKESKKDGAIGGVCAALANSFGINITFIRMLWICLTILSGGIGVLIYLLCWLVMFIA